LSIPFLVDEKPNVLRAARLESGRDPRERFLGAAFALNQLAAPSACIGRRYSAVRWAEPGDCERCARARSFQAVGVRRRGHGRWGVRQALELQIRTADLTGRSCSDELLRGSAEQRWAVEYTTSKTPARCHVRGGEIRQGVKEEAVSSFVGYGVPTGVVFRLGALRTSYIKALGQHY
jgi:hypothetical protein